MATAPGTSGAHASRGCTRPRTPCRILRAKNSASARSTQHVFGTKQQQPTCFLSLLPSILHPTSGPHLPLSCLPRPTDCISTPLSDPRLAGLSTSWLLLAGSEYTLTGVHVPVCVVAACWVLPALGVVLGRSRLSGSAVLFGLRCCSHVSSASLLPFPSAFSHLTRNTEYIHLLFFLLLLPPPLVLN